MLGLVAITVLTGCKPTPQPSSSSEELSTTTSVIPPSVSEWTEPSPVWSPTGNITFTPLAAYTGTFWNTINMNLRGEDLKLAIKNYLDPIKTLITYSETYNAVREMDKDPNNEYNILSLYDLKSQSGSSYNGGRWNREHTFPQSKIADGDDSKRAINNVANASSDIANLFACDAELNTYRSNNSYAEVNYESDKERFYPFLGTNTSGVVTDSLLFRGYFSPTRMVRGEVARAQLYMLLMYPDQCSLTENFAIQDMIRWDRELAPTVERDGQRQAGIQKYQNIRNPFIDNRNLSCYIWGDTNTKTRELCSSIY